MTAPGGFGGLGPGAISIMAEIADDRICSMRVASSRPTNLTKLFIGRCAADAPALAERLFSLCGFSHAVAARRAISAARADVSASGVRPLEAIGLLCERVSESLRPLAGFTSSADVFTLDAAAIAALRSVFSLTRELVALSSVDPGATSRGAGKSLAERIRAAGGELGIPDWQRAGMTPPKPDSWFGKLWRQLESDRSFAASIPDRLEPEDDHAVLKALRVDSENFAASPSLVGRTPETGAFARHWREADLTGGALLARLHTRIVDLAQSIEKLDHAAKGDLNGSDARSFTPASCEGFAVVETARGALYHWARLTADDKVQDYAIVAPTEWNFHPAGPFVAAALGARAPRDTAQRSLARLATLFDPCVVFRVDVLESANA